MGYATQLQDIMVDGSPSWNVIADREGGAAGERTHHGPDVGRRGQRDAEALAASLAKTGREVRRG